MFDEPNEQPAEHARDPAERAKEKSDELRMHAELFAVFEGCRKFDAAIRPDLNPDLARDIQQTIGRLEKSKSPDHPILLPDAVPDAARLLTLPTARDLPTNDYHIHRRPGEVIIVRWLAGEEVETFYQRFQAHFEAALEGLREDERHAQEWKQDPQTLAYLKALDAIEAKMADRYLRGLIRQHNLCVLSTQTADELNIQYLADYAMEVPAEEIVGRASTPPDDPTEHDLAWFFRLLSLRGMDEGVERMCFFTYLQKTEDTFEGEW
jgi:hypothetical protein